MLCTLMNKDIPMLDLEIYLNSVKVLRVYNELPKYMADANNWLFNRVQPISRASLVNMLKNCGINNIEQYDYSMYAISVTDTYWIKPFDKDLSWDDINPHKNSLSKLASKYILNGIYDDIDLKLPSPDYRLDGTAEKFLKHVNGKLCLYKTNGETYGGEFRYAGIRPYCEYYANQVIKALEVPDIEYVKYRINAKRLNEYEVKPYVCCDSFTNDDTGFIPIENTIFKDCDIKELLYRTNGQNRETLLNMVMIDAITVNIDRHTENYGFTVDNNTLKLKGIAPIFDMDCSLGAITPLYDTNENKQRAFERGLWTIQRNNRFGFSDFISQGKSVLNTLNFKSRLKNMYPFHFKRLPKDIDLPDGRIQFMEYIVNSQIKNILS